MDYADKFDMMDDDCDIQGYPLKSIFLSYEEFVTVLNRINNIAVGFIEGGPYEDANSVALVAMQKIDGLSKL